MSRYFSPGGVPTRDVASYYRRRAESGLGLIFTEGTAVAHPVAVDNPGSPRLHGEDALTGWRGVVDAVHAAGCPIWPQLWHQGPMFNVEFSGQGDFTALRPSGIWGPSDGVISLRPEVREASLADTAPMSDEDIADAIESYAVAARNAAQLGFDGIAIHGAHGYLIDSFLWHYTNRRSDRWGGTHAGRAAFGAAVVRAIRGAIGDEMPIALRISQFKMQDYQARLAETPDELAELLGPLADAGVDLFDCSQRFFDTPLFEGSQLNLGQEADGRGQYDGGRRRPGQERRQGGAYRSDATDDQQSAATGRTVRTRRVRPGGGRAVGAQRPRLVSPCHSGRAVSPF